MTFAGLLSPPGWKKPDAATADQFELPPPLPWEEHFDASESDEDESLSSYTPPSSPPWSHVVPNNENAEYEEEEGEEEEEVEEKEEEWSGDSHEDIEDEWQADGHGEDDDEDDDEGEDDDEAEITDKGSPPPKIVGSQEQEMNEATDDGTLSSGAVGTIAAVAAALAALAALALFAVRRKRKNAEIDPEAEPFEDEDLFVGGDDLEFPEDFAEDETAVPPPPPMEDAGGDVEGGIEMDDGYLPNSQHDAEMEMGTIPEDTSLQSEGQQSI